MPETDLFAVLTTPPPRLTERQVCGFVEANWGLAGDVSSLVSDRDQNFALRAADDARYVIKIGNSAEDTLATDCQVEVLLHIRAMAADFPSPDVVNTLDGEASATLTAPDSRQHVCRVLTWLEGTQMQDAAIDSLAESMAACLARLDAILAGFDHPGSNVPLLWDISHASHLRDHADSIDDDELREICGEHLEKFESQLAPVLRGFPRQAIHNDFSPGNVLVDPDDHDRVVGIIDFGDIVRAPLIVDVAVACAYLCIGQSDPAREVERFTRVFQQGIELADQELEILDDLILTRLVVSATISHWRAK
ncbi:MAG: phosphotransferase, partial [Woeseiaceae bacterium]